MTETFWGWVLITAGSLFIIPCFIMLDPSLLSSVAMPAGIMLGFGIALVIT